jgi:hypothetical protein
MDHVNGQVIKNTALSTDSDVAKSHTAISSTAQALVNFRQENNYSLRHMNKVHNTTKKLVKSRCMSDAWDK